MMNKSWWGLIAAARKNEYDIYVCLYAYMYRSTSAFSSDMKRKKKRKLVDHTN